MKSNIQQLISYLSNSSVSILSMIKKRVLYYAWISRILNYTDFEPL